MKALEMMIKIPSYGDVTVGYCMEFSGSTASETKDAEFYIECNADSKTYQLEVELKEGQK